MNMKRYLLILLSFVTISSFADTTNDKIVLSKTTLDPGSDAVEVTVSLDGVDNHMYCGFNIDIVIPEWLDVEKTYDPEERTDVYCLMDYSRTSIFARSHTMSSNVLYIDGKKTIRTACTSQSNASFYASSGVLFSFKLKASSMAKPGVVNISIVKTDFGKYDATTTTTTYYHFADSNSEDVSVSSHATTTLNISGDVKWSTCMLPFSMDVPEGVKAFSCVERDEQNCLLKLTEVSTMEAFVPYILFSENGYNETLTGSVEELSYPSSGVVESGYLSGAVVSQKITSGYVLQNLSSGVKFYSCGGDEFTIPAGKCWVNGAGSEAKAFVMPTDVVSTISNTRMEQVGAKCYTVSGALTDGNAKNRLYIKDGKKIINR